MDAANYSLSDIAAATGDNDGMFGGGGNGLWLLALIFIFAMVFGFNGFGGRGGGEHVTESALCNSNNFTDLQNSVGRLGNAVEQKADTLGQGIYNLGYNQLAQVDQLAQQIAAENTNTRVQLSECCCTTQRGIDSVNYNAALNTSAINANIDAKFAAIEKGQLEQRIADQQNQLNQLSLQSALCGVVRYPTSSCYCGGANPFYGGCGCASI